MDWNGVERVERDAASRIVLAPIRGVRELAALCRIRLRRGDHELQPYRRLHCRGLTSEMGAVRRRSRRTESIAVASRSCAMKRRRRSHRKSNQHGLALHRRLGR
jgi:hypothetical protein